MRQVHSNITPSLIHQNARTILQAVLLWKPVGKSVAVGDLLDLLLLMASATASLFAIVQRFFAFSHETARRAVNANLPTLEVLQQGLVKAYQAAAFEKGDAGGNSVVTTIELEAAMSGSF